MIESQFIVDPDGRIIQRVGWRRLKSVDVKPMAVDNIEAEIEKLLPCVCQGTRPTSRHYEYNKDCHAYYRPAVAEFCRGLVADRDKRIARIVELADENYTEIILDLQEVIPPGGEISRTEILAYLDSRRVHKPAKALRDRIADLESQLSAERASRP